MIRHATSARMQARARDERRKCGWRYQSAGSTPATRTASATRSSGTPSKGPLMRSGHSSAAAAKSPQSEYTGGHCTRLDSMTITPCVRSLDADSVFVARRRDHRRLSGRPHRRRRLLFQAAAQPRRIFPRAPVDDVAAGRLVADGGARQRDRLPDAALVDDQVRADSAHRHVIVAVALSVGGSRHAAVLPAAELLHRVRVSRGAVRRPRPQPGRRHLHRLAPGVDGDGDLRAVPGDQRRDRRADSAQPRPCSCSAASSRSIPRWAACRR